MNLIGYVFAKLGNAKDVVTSMSRESRFKT